MTGWREVARVGAYLSAHRASLRPQASSRAAAEARSLNLGEL